MMNETQSESNATHQVNHLTTNLSESSGFGEGPVIAVNLDNKSQDQSGREESKG